MFVIMGGTGHIGSATAEALLRRGEEVTIITRDAPGAAEWRDRGADIAEADVEDIASLRNAFRRGRRAFLLNPPADPSTAPRSGARRRTSSRPSKAPGWRRWSRNRPTAPAPAIGSAT